MARTHRRRRTSGYERKIDHREWFTSQISQQIDPSDNNELQGHVFAPAMSLRSDDCTILRTRGCIDVFGAGLPANSPIRLVFGMLVLPAKFAAVTSALPSPLIGTDSDDWFVWLHARHVTTGSWDFMIDSKAMRKVQADEVAVQVLAFQSPVTAFASGSRLNVSGVVRVLVGY